MAQKWQKWQHPDMRDGDTLAARGILLLFQPELLLGASAFLNCS
jgi:hypothetical protein